MHINRCAWAQLALLCLLTTGCVTNMNSVPAIQGPNQVRIGTTVRFSATGDAAGGPEATWFVDGKPGGEDKCGTIALDGVFTPPSVPVPVEDQPQGGEPRHFPRVSKPTSPPIPPSQKKAARVLARFPRDTHTIQSRFGTAVHHSKVLRFREDCFITRTADRKPSNQISLLRLIYDPHPLLLFALQPLRQLL